MNQPLTNQELLTELEKRIQAGTLQVEVSADEVEKKSTSLLSALSSKQLLFLAGLTVGFTLIIYYSITLTTSSVASCNFEIKEPNNQIKIGLKN